MIFFYRKTKNC